MPVLRGLLFVLWFEGVFLALGWVTVSLIQLCAR